MESTLITPSILSDTKALRFNVLSSTATSGIYQKNMKYNGSRIDIAVLREGVIYYTDEIAKEFKCDECHKHNKQSMSHKIGLLVQDLLTAGVQFEKCILVTSPKLAIAFSVMELL